jgi:hypothetical protein
LFLHPSGAVAIYESASGEWRTARLSESRRDIAVAVAGDQVLFAGGSVGGHPSATVDIYDSRTGTWGTATLSEARAAPEGVAVVGSRALFAGGVPSGRVDVYDAATGAWTTAVFEAPGPP